MRDGCVSRHFYLLVVPAGQFLMGSPPGEPDRDDEGPQHTVTIARPFAAGKYEVTFDEWDACVAGGGCARAADESRRFGRERQLVVAKDSPMSGNQSRLVPRSRHRPVLRFGGKSTAKLNFHFSAASSRKWNGGCGWDDLMLPKPPAVSGEGCWSGDRVVGDQCITSPAHHWAYLKCSSAVRR